MKKLLCFVTSVAMCGMFAVSTFAANGVTADEQKVLDNLKKGAVVDGVTVTVPTEYIGQAEAFLATNDVTAEQVEAILVEIEAVRTIVTDNGIKSIEELKKSSHASKVFGHAQKAASIVGVTLKVNADGSVTGVDKNGKEVFNSKSTNEVIKDTGDNYSIMFVMTGAIAVVLAGAGVVAGKKGYFAK